MELLAGNFGCLSNSVGRMFGKTKTFVKTRLNASHENVTYPYYMLCEIMNWETCLTATYSYYMI